MAVQDHGTHVAGTVGCNLDTPADVDGVEIPYAVSGVAPAAQLGNYNIFPGDIDNARSEDIVDALQAAYADGMDVVNMSLGGGASGALDIMTVAVDNLDLAGMVSAVAAGNSGPGHYTIESPGSAERALTAGASTVGHFVGAPMTVGASTYRLATGDFATVESDLTAPLAAVPGTVNGLSTACTAVPAGSLTGKIAVVSRGTCVFSAKVKAAQDAGAVATVVVNNVTGDPIAMAGSVPSGSGQTRRATVTLSSLTGTAVTVTPTVDSVVGSGVAFSVPSSPVTVPATGSVTLTVTVTVTQGAPAGDHSAMLRLSTGGAEAAHSVLYAFVV